jgi:hypothetical protein
MGNNGIVIIAIDSSKQAWKFPSLVKKFKAKGVI